MPGQSDTQPWVLTDEDCETGFLGNAPEGISPEDALSMFLDLFAKEFGEVVSVDGEPLDAELRRFREPREDEDTDSILVACSPSEKPDAMVWVIEGIEWVR